MTGQNIWRLCKVYGRMIAYPELKPHDLRHGVAMEVLEQHHDFDQVRALLGHARIDTTQIYGAADRRSPSARCHSTRKLSVRWDRHYPAPPESLAFRP